MQLTLVNWNVEWATPGSRRTPEILRRIDRHSPHIVCLTEAHTELLVVSGYTICSRAGSGYRTREEMRKVVLWSKEPWERIDDLGSDDTPPGRFASGVTRTPIGDVTLIGICIPWAGSRTEARRGSERSRRWEDHERYLVELAELLERMPAGPTIVVGDFNQRFGQGAATPYRMRSALRNAFPARMTIATAGVGLRGRRTLDHIGLSDELSAETLGVLSNICGESRLSDHFGVVAALRDVTPKPWTIEGTIDD